MGMSKKGEKWSSFVFVWIFLLALLGAFMIDYEDDGTTSPSGFQSLSALEKTSVGIVLTIFVIFALAISIVAKILKSKHHIDVSKSIVKVNSDIGRIGKEIDDLDQQLK